MAPRLNRDAQHTDTKALKGAVMSTADKCLCPYHGTAYTNDCVCCGAAMYRNRQERLENVDPEAHMNTQLLHTLTSPCGAQYVVLGEDSGDLEACMAPGDILVTEELQIDANVL